MGAKNKEVDAYIANALPFAQPILKRIRMLFHRACPPIEEKLKWGVPSFEYKGIVGGFAAFKHYATWGLWKAALLNDPHGAMAGNASSPMGAGKLTDVSQLPPDAVIIDLIKQAVELNESGVKLPQRSAAREKRPIPKSPADLSGALKKSPKAAAIFQAFSPSHKREYIAWITEAKQDETRMRRLAQAIAWISEGKPRNWKYIKR